MKPLPSIILLFMLGLLMTRPGMAEPRFFNAEYVVHANGFKVGEMTRRYKQADDGQLRFETHMVTTGLLALFNKDEIHMSSNWRDIDGQLTPMKYHASYTGRKKDREEILNFDWETSKATSHYKGETRTIKLDQLLYDKLNYQTALKRDLARGLKKLHYRIIDRGRIRDYQFEVLGEERMVTSLGEFTAIKVARDETTFWCAVELDYLMVKIEQVKDDYTLTSYITAGHFSKTEASSSGD